MKIRQILRTLGPGLITGASDDDPSGIATYSQAGAKYGFALLWTMPLIYPLLVAIQEVSARIGRVTGKGLSANIKEHYNKPVAFVFILLLLIANTINIGADIGAIGESLTLLGSGHSLLYSFLITLGTSLLIIFIPYAKYVKILRWLTLTLFAYIAVAFIVEVDWLEAIQSIVIPHISLTKEYLTMVIALLGTTISPYLFYWQASEEVEEEENDPNAKPLIETPKQAQKEFKRINIDTSVGMAFSNTVAFFIMLATASTLHKTGITEIESAAQAAQALEPLAGKYASLLFSFGIIGTGLLALPVLAGSVAYAIGELLGYPVGLEKKPREAKVFYGVIAGILGVGFLLNFIGISPMKALYYAAVANGILSVPIMFMMMIMSRNTKIMGKLTLSKPLKILGWMATIVMFLAALGSLL
jgi:NRAMP (natural resistance-associated macrophage protein)-like metal ion transporter